jgi:hypothetical protein
MTKEQALHLWQLATHVPPDSVSQGTRPFGPYDFAPGEPIQGCLQVFSLITEDGADTGGLLLILGTPGGPAEWRTTAFAPAP